MSLSHAIQETSISSAGVFKNLLDNVNSLQKNVNHLLFSECEIKLHDMFAKAERACIKKILESFD